MLKSLLGTLRTHQKKEPSGPEELPPAFEFELKIPRGTIYLQHRRLSEGPVRQFLVAGLIPDSDDTGDKQNSDFGPRLLIQTADGLIHALGRSWPLDIRGSQFIGIVQCVGDTLLNAWRGGLADRFRKETIFLARDRDVMRFLDSAPDKNDPSDSWPLACYCGVRLWDFFSPFDMFPGPASGSSEEVGTLNRRLIPALRKARAAFEEALDTDALNTCKLLGAFTPSAYNYLAGSNPVINRYRREAVCLLPVLAKFLIEDSGVEATSIRVSIDGRKSLIDVVAASFCVPKEVVRYLISEARLEEQGSLTWSDAGFELALHPQRLLQVLSSVPSEKRPRTIAAWRIFFRFYDLLSPLDDDPRLIESFFHEAGMKGWKDTWDTIAWLYGSIEALRDLSACLNEIEVAAEFENLSNGFSSHTNDIKASVAKDDGAPRLSPWFQRKGLLQLLPVSRRWHQLFQAEVRQRIGEADNAKDISLGFPFDKPIEVEGLQVVPLLSYAAFIDEGMQMDHCVATLYHDCRRTGRRVFSVRNSKGEPLSTFDLSFNREAGTGIVLVRLNEHRGPHNTEPSRQCVRAAKSFIRLLEDAAEDWRLDCLTASPPVEEDPDEDFSEDDDDIIAAAKQAAAVRVLKETAQHDAFLRRLLHNGDERSEQASDAQ